MKSFEGLSFLGMESVIQKWAESIGVSSSELKSSMVSNDCEHNKKIKTTFDNYYFCALSLAHPKIKRILEFGTGFGERTTLFNKLWPDAVIDTIDISEGDPSFDDYAIRAKNEERNQMFEKAISLPNVNFYNTNSFFVPTVLPKVEYDLVYVDGAHYFPFCAMDMQYGYLRCSAGGHILFHDYGGLDVTKSLDSILAIIPESATFLPFAVRRPNKAMAYFRKESVTT